MRARGPSARAAAAVACLVATAACEPPPLPLDLGVPWELAEHRARTIVSPRYQIRLDVPERRADPVEGRSLIIFGWSDPDEQPLVIDFLDPAERVSGLRVNGAEVTWEAVNDHIVIPADALRNGALNEVDVSYRAGDEALNRSDDFLYSLFVPDRAHFSLPVFDQPNLKARVRWTVSAPREWRVIANTGASDYSMSDERSVHQFLESRPLPTYLFAVAAGRFEREEAIVGDRFLEMFHRETDTATVARNRDTIFELHAHALDWLEDYTGIEYPFEKFGFVLIPSFQYGGMEHPGGILYRQAGLMLDESATQSQILGRASVISHETAHMWFGNLVTMNWFDDVWTKEVFANFMASKIVHPSFPDVDHELRFLTAHHPAAYGVDRTAGANAIRQPLENLREAGTLYGPIIYQKAPIVMRHLEARVGEEAFRDGLREYLETFSYGNATWPALIDILDRRSAADLAAWSSVWIEEPGRPTITVERSGADVVLRQSDPAGEGRVWPQTLEVRTGSAAGTEVVTVEIGQGEARIEGAGDAPFVLPNGSGVEYGAFVLDERSVSYLVENVSDLRPALVRGAAWVTLWDQVLEQRLRPEAFFDAALSAVAAEDVELILDRLLGYLETAFWRLLTPPQRAERLQAFESTLWNGVRSGRPRTARASLFGTYRSVATSVEALARLERIWRGTEELPGLPLSEADETALAGELALREVEGWPAVLDEQEGRIENPDRLARFRFVRPSLSADPAERDAFFASLRDPANREREPWVLEGLGNLHHPLRAAASLAMIRPALDMLPEIQRTGDIFFPGRWLDATLGGHASPEAARIVRSFLEEAEGLPPRLRQSVLRSADMLYRSARIGEQEG